jgi:hypothetical protein
VRVPSAIWILIPRARLLSCIPAFILVDQRIPTCRPPTHGGGGGYSKGAMISNSLMAILFASPVSAWSLFMHAVKSNPSLKCFYFLLLIKYDERLRWSRGSVLAFGTQVRGFKPGRSRRIFLAKKFLSTPSFGGEVKPSIPCRALRHVKEPKSDVQVATFGKISRSFLAHSSTFRC